MKPKVKEDLPSKLDVEHELEQIAKGLSEADAARVRTLIYLAGRQETNVTIPVPMTLAEKVDRSIPILRSLGKYGCQLAYRKAFLTKRSKITDIPIVSVDDMDLTGVRMPVSLKQFNRMAPEAKQSGMPVGYPRDGSLDEKKEWVQKQYIRVLRARQQKELNASRDSEAAEGDTPAPVVVAE